MVGHLSAWIGHTALMGLVVLEAASPSVQRFYIEGVPYTDRHGKALNTWDPDRSFLMIGSWSVPESRIYKGVEPLAPAGRGSLQHGLALAHWRMLLNMISR